MFINAYFLYLQKQWTMDNNNQVVKVLWTGGFDSSFRIVELSRMSVTVQPYYIRNKGRKSAEREILAMKKIRRLISQKPKIKFNLLPLIISDMPERISSDILEAFETITKNEHLGNQYTYLAEFAKTNQGLELGVVNSHGMRTNIFDHYVKIEDSLTGSNYIIDKSKISESVYTLFKNVRFPISIYTKLEMRDLYIKWGYKDVMNATWFCHNPVFGVPCGLCNPCKCTIEEGMKWRFPFISLAHRRLRPHLNKCKRFFFK